MSCTFIATWIGAPRWIGWGASQYLIAEHGGNPVAALACPPDPKAVAWIRLFAVSSGISLEKAWEALWPEALERLQAIPGLRYAAAIPLQQWFHALLAEHGFIQTHRVVMLSWDAKAGETRDGSFPFTIRPMNFDDLEAVEAVDQAAFEDVWQNSKESLELAFKQAAVATVVEVDDTLAGYQISTATPMGGHLARLAVHPHYQRQGIGMGLVRDMLSQFERRGALTVTVNTQQDNVTSLGLYERIGFHRTGEEYPVYQFEVSG